MTSRKRSSSCLVSSGDPPKKNRFDMTSRFAKSFSADSDFITFYSKSACAAARSLSNFSAHAIRIEYSFVNSLDCCLYPTGEHAFQGAKFKILSNLTSEDRRQQLLDHAQLFEGETLKSCVLKSPNAAKQAGGKGGVRLSEEELAIWNTFTMVVQEQICRQKLLDPMVREFLLSSDGRYLVHNERATTWPRYGATVLKPENSPFHDGLRWMKGDNLLGKMWMDLREETIATENH